MEKLSGFRLNLIFVGIILSLIILTVCALNTVENIAISYEEQVQTACSEITLQEKRKNDLIPYLADYVKQYDEYEHKILTETIEARNIYPNANESQNISEVITENYPDSLKSFENYKEFMHEITITENRILSARHSYNSYITRYNEYVRQFPTKQILSLLGYTPVDYERLSFAASENIPTELASLLYSPESSPSDDSSDDTIFSTGSSEEESCSEENTSDDEYANQDETADETVDENNSTDETNSTENENSID